MHRQPRPLLSSKLCHSERSEESDTEKAGPRAGTGLFRERLSGEKGILRQNLPDKLESDVARNAEVVNVRYVSRKGFGDLGVVG